MVNAPTSTVLAAITCVVALQLVVLGGCNRTTHDSVQKDAVAQINKLTGVLKRITDQPSAQAAASKVSEIVADMKKLKQQASAMPKPSADEQRALSKAHEKEFKDAIDGLGARE